MSKYDFEIDLSDRTSTGIILNKIKPGSVVLEFGCATGRMTRYMKEAMDCKVYIVEFDAGAYEKALQFAAGGVCGDIMTYSWLEEFRDVRFDAVIFADVLEHLSRPEEVLAKAAELLKDTGSIYVSVPNITHNDILLKACTEHFDYTRTGLLDEDHIHFWGLENLKALPRRCGLNVRSIEGTCCATGDSEQAISGNGQMLLTNLLRQRRAGEVYQFVITLDRGETAQPVCTIRPPAVRSHIYLDTGSGFHPDQCIPVNAAYTEDGTYQIRTELEAPDGLCRIRLDPVEWQGCILLHAALNRGETEFAWSCSEGVYLHQGIYLPGEDPMIWAEVPEADGPIRIRAEFLIPDERYLAALEKNLVHQNERILGQRKTLERLGLDGTNAEEGVAGWLSLKDQTVRQAGELEKIREQLDCAEKENAQIRGELCGYIILSDRKERLLIEKKCRIAEMERQLAEREGQLAEREGQLAERNQQLAETQWQLRDLERKTRVYMKFRRFAVRVYRGLKWRIKRILGR